MIKLSQNPRDSLVKLYYKITKIYKLIVQKFIIFITYHI